MSCFPYASLSVLRSVFHTLYLNFRGIVKPKTDFSPSNSILPSRRALPGLNARRVGETSWSRCTTVSGQGYPAYRTRYRTRMSRLTAKMAFSQKLKRSADFLQRTLKFLPRMNSLPRNGVARQGNFLLCLFKNLFKHLLNGFRAEPAARQKSV